MDDILDRLASGVIDGPEDLMGLGECLNLLDRLESSSEFPASSSGMVGELKMLINRLILEDSSEPQQDWLRIHTLISALRSGTAVPSPIPLHPPEVDWRNIRKLVDDLSSSAPEANENLADWEMETGVATAKPKEAEHILEESEIQDPELLKDFIEEAREHLSSIELNMLALETDPKDQEAINSVFRPFHSIKGVAGFLNLADIQHLTHEVENLLDSARAGTLLITDSVIDLVLSAVDILKVLLVDLEKMQAAGSTMLKASHLVPPFLVRVKNFSADDPIEPGTPVRKVGQILVERGVVENDIMENLAERTKNTGKKLGEEIVSEGIADVRDVSQALREQRRTKENAASVRIDTLKLDNLVDMVGELVIAQSMVLQNPEVRAIKDQQLQKDSVQLSRITAELQRISMSMRMVPIKSTFQKMIRLVRDVSRKSGKDVNLEMRGEDTEIDRNMVEEIYEPLVHMIRNSVDHGVESPDERRQAGKDPTGTIVLAAEQKGGNIVIDIEDNGQGLDTERILAKGIERGVVSPDDHLDEKAIFELIMHPGFSTREQVTEVSGRGVGMDVVKRSVERLRGKVEISSTLGHGTHFQLKLPLTMAIIDGMIIQIGMERYVVPTIALKESLRPRKEHYMTVQGKGELIKVRDSLMPLVRLHGLFGVEPRFINPWEGLLLVVTEGNSSYCLLADEIVGRQEVVIKSLGGSMRNLLGISGGAILGDGKVALIIDVKGVVSLYEDTTK